MLGYQGIFNAGRGRSAPTTPVLPTPILDDLSISASVAYSLRKLRNAYVGNCIRVRRSSDNAEQDIGFLNGIIDVTALLTFIGSNNGFVTTWYDQSGNGVNATQTTAGNQPAIVTSGEVLSYNGKPTIVFTNSHFTLSPITPGDFSSFTVQGKPLAGNRIGTLLNITGGAALPFLPYQYSDGNVYLGNSTGYGSFSDSSTSQKIFSAFSISNTRSIWMNGVSKTITSIGAVATNTFNALASRSSEASTGFISEVVLVSSDVSAQRTAAEANINSFYTTY